MVLLQVWLNLGALRDLVSLQFLAFLSCVGGTGSRRGHLAFSRFRSFQCSQCQEEKKIHAPEISTGTNWNSPERENLSTGARAQGIEARPEGSLVLLTAALLATWDAEEEVTKGPEAQEKEQVARTLAQEGHA